MFKQTKSHWVWTELTQSLHPDRVAGQPVYEAYRTTVPLSWYEKGYVREAGGGIEPVQILLDFETEETA
ncbi:hypothetical protein [Paenibacillus spongiae]|uniref:Uncharacterized protein n=1 Tax=Paenibacillus spongiae TaxID=2909671 RepID=A0ABY5SB67_9BACL|nr:hypothetical protein [Paenibacillus spongiae]UVI31191.1 hypothetical protein L1F29_04935 [Paenibacillus spongiae]